MDTRSELRAKWDARDHLYAAGPGWGLTDSQIQVIRLYRAAEAINIGGTDLMIQEARSWTPPTVIPKGRSW